MNIGLIDVDGHNFPNLALMKIAGYHKRKGDAVEWVNGFFQYESSATAYAWFIWEKGFKGYPEIRWFN